MFIRMQSLEDGIVRTLEGYTDSTGTDVYTSVEPPRLNRLSRIVARIEMQCDENQNGLETTKRLLSDLLAEIESRINAQQWTPKL